MLLYAEVAKVIRQVDFQSAVLNGMLAFLLFAGALQSTFSRYCATALWAVGSMATIGTLISTAIVGLRFLGHWPPCSICVPVPLVLGLSYSAPSSARPTQ